jgi:hypothetical protein
MTTSSNSASSKISPRHTVSLSKRQGLALRVIRSASTSGLHTFGCRVGSVSMKPVRVVPQETARGFETEARNRSNCNRGNSRSNSVNVTILQIPISGIPNGYRFTPGREERRKSCILRHVCGRGDFYIQGTLEKNPSVKVFLSGSSQHFLSLDMGVLSGLRFAQGRFSLESFRVVNFLHVLGS